MILTLTREENKGTVMMVDLDGFKVINDINGHHAGDLLLIEVAKRLRDAVRLSDTVARLGGDEFVVLLPKADITTSSDIAKKITTAMSEPIVIEGKTHFVHASIGMSVYPDHADDAERLLKLADAAMYSTKRTPQRVAVHS
jgi:diguanylate cyclase (GGDEF)-like protein